MKKVLIIFSLMMLLVACGKDDNNPEIDEPVKPDPVQPSNKNPNELVGTWELYSGNPVTVLSSIGENNILNHTFIFVDNGNMNETVVHPDANKYGTTSSVYGNWYVDNKQLKFTNWQGNVIDGYYSYMINADSSLTLSIGGKSAIYYKRDEMKKKYPDLIVGSWNNMRDGAAKTRMTFYDTGRGYSQSNYINGFYMGGEPFSWSYSDNIISVDYDNISKPTGHHEYVINYLNTKSISWLYKNEAKHYVRE